MTIMRNAQFRILPPQPASPVSTGQHAQTPQNRALPRQIRGYCLVSVSRIGLQKAPFRPLVSEATFWCLVFAEGRARSPQHGGPLVIDPHLCPYPESAGEKQLRHRAAHRCRREVMRLPPLPDAIRPLPADRPGRGIPALDARCAHGHGTSACDRSAG